MAHETFAKSEKNLLLKQIQEFDDKSSYANLNSILAEINNSYLYKHNEMTTERDFELNTEDLNTLIKLSRYSALENKYEDVIDINMTTIKNYNYSSAKISFTTTTKIIDNLVKLGYAERYQLNNNRKTIYVRVTQKGIDYCKRREERVIQYAEKNMSYLTPDERKTFFEYNKKILELYLPLIKNTKL